MGKRMGELGGEVPIAHVFKCFTRDFSSNALNNKQQRRHQLCRMGFRSAYLDEHQPHRREHA